MLSLKLPKLLFFLLPKILIENPSCYFLMHGLTVDEKTNLLTCLINIHVTRAVVKTLTMLLSLRTKCKLGRVIFTFRKIWTQTKFIFDNKIGDTGKNCCHIRLPVLSTIGNQHNILIIVTCLITAYRKPKYLKFQQWVKLTSIYGIYFIYIPYR